MTNNINNASIVYQRQNHHSSCHRIEIKLFSQDIGYCQYNLIFSSARTRERVDLRSLSHVDNHTSDADSIQRLPRGPSLNTIFYSGSELVSAATWGLGIAGKQVND